MFLVNKTCSSLNINPFYEAKTLLQEAVSSQIRRWILFQLPKAIVTREMQPLGENAFLKTPRNSVREYPCRESFH